MSRSWRTTQLIAAADTFGGRLEKYGVREKLIEAFNPWELIDGQEPIMEKPPNGDAWPKIPGTTERNRFLTDGNDFRARLRVRHYALATTTRTTFCGLSTENSKPGSMMKIIPTTGKDMSGERSAIILTVSLATTQPTKSNSSHELL